MGQTERVFATHTAGALNGGPPMSPVDFEKMVMSPISIFEIFLLILK